MKSPVVHKLMRKHFIAILHEQGFVRPMAPTTGIACMNHAGFHIRMGYELGVGFYDWTGNDLRLVGTITTVGRLKRSLQANIVQPDDLLPPVLRSELRVAALDQLSKIIQSARAMGREVPAFFLTTMRRAEADHLYVPDYRYQTEDNLKWWCAIVRPHMPDCIKALRSEAEQLRLDTETNA